MEPQRPEIRVLNAMSVDVEDYFHTEATSKAVSREIWGNLPCRVERNTEALLELFANHDVRATFFFLGWVAERYPRLVRKTKTLGHEIACHSYWHRPVHALTPAEFREDTHRAKGVIEDAAGIAIQGYRAPSFSLTPGTDWALEILAEAGFTYDSSVHPIAHDLYDNRHAPRKAFRATAALLEIPISTTPVGNRSLPFSGGGYFRMLPYPYVRWAMKKLNHRERQAGVFYIHPWEIDPGQPRLEITGLSKFRQYVGLDGTMAKLRRLCADFSFTTLGKAFSGYLPESRQAVSSARFSEPRRVGL